MKIYTPWLGLAALVLTTPAWSQTPNIDEIWAIVQRQQLEIEQLKQQLAAADAMPAASPEPGVECL